LKKTEKKIKKQPQKGRKRKSMEMLEATATSATNSF